MALADDLNRILWTEDQIAGRVAELASQISGDFKHLSPSLVVVGVATGAFVFLADIVRKITLPVVVDFIRVESYGSGTESSGTPRICSDIKVDVSEKHVILVEDIVDTGNTLSCLIPHLEKKGASSVSVCTFLDKPARRRAQFQLVGDGKFYNGFECPDEFVVGYGMDFAERKKMKISREIADASGKTMPVEEILTIDIKPGWKKGTKITFPEKGNESPNVIPADIVFIVDEKPHSVFTRDGNDLIVTQKVTLIEALTGYTVNLTTLDGRNLTIPINTIIHPGYEEVVPREGMPIPKDPSKKGNLRIKFNIKFPTRLTAEQKVGLKRLLAP